MIRRLTILLLIVGCDMFESDDDVDTGHWTCAATFCVYNAYYERDECQISNSPFLIHANSKAAAKRKCLDAVSDITVIDGYDNVEITCDCSEGVQDNLNSPVEPDEPVSNE